MLTSTYRTAKHSVVLSLLLGYTWSCTDILRRSLQRRLSVEDKQSRIRLMPSSYYERVTYRGANDVGPSSSAHNIFLISQHSPSCLIHYASWLCFVSLFIFLFIQSCRFVAGSHSSLPVLFALTFSLTFSLILLNSSPICLHYQSNLLSLPVLFTLTFSPDYLHLFEYIVYKYLQKSLLFPQRLPTLPPFHTQI